MPLSIPYNPAFALGQIIDPSMLTTLTDISACQGLIEGAHDKLKSFIAMKRSIDMTIQELTNMNVDTTGLIGKTEEIGKAIIEAATEYATIRMEQEERIQQLKVGMSTVHTAPESPVDFEKTRIRTMPLSADSMTMDAQYFSFNENEQNKGRTVATIRDFIDSSTNMLGDDVSGKISAAATSQLIQQKENHQIAGTLIITASCTHREAVMLSPLVLDADKAVMLWNQLFPEEGDKINVKNPAGVKMISGEGDESGKSISLLSGATFGSSFVGMVHVLNQETTKPVAPELIESMQERLTVGKWFTKETGGFGVDPFFANELRQLISSQQIQAHVTIVTMGLVPSIKSNEVRIGVKTMSDASSGRLEEDLSIVTETTDALSTVSSLAGRAQSGAEMLAIKNSSTQNIMMGLSRIDEKANGIIDINSMMTAFEDYIGRVKDGKAGVPINYYISPLTKARIVEGWISKYYPQEKSSLRGEETTKDSGEGS